MMETKCTHGLLSKYSLKNCTLSLRKMGMPKAASEIMKKAVKND
jgi:hypothetical protein